MHDSRGGFIIEAQAADDANSAALQAAQKNKPQSSIESLQKLATIDTRPVFMDPVDNVVCIKCKSIDIDLNYEKYFNELVCRACREAYPDEYSLLTKTECKEDYLLTDSELKDTTRLPCWPKANPHKSTYSNMLLYLRKQVEAFAFEKWGSEAALDAEFQRRDAEKQDRKAKQFKKKLAELRKKTRTSAWQLERNTDHEHTYGPDSFDADTNTHYRTCNDNADLNDFSGAIPTSLCSLKKLTFL
eukprot:jgi/Hompol1/5602/HPOL_001222-RA